MAEQWHPPMAETVRGLFDGLQLVQTGAVSVRARSVEMDLPLEALLGSEGSETVLLAGLPLWRWRTDFDRIPGRLRMRWQEEAR